MARFKYLGEPLYPYLATQGTTDEIRLKMKNGTTHVIYGPAGGFVIGNDIGEDITDDRALRALRADVDRFEEI